MCYSVWLRMTRMGLINHYVQNEGQAIVASFNTDKNKFSIAEFDTIDEIHLRKIQRQKLTWN